MLQVRSDETWINREEEAQSTKWITGRVSALQTQRQRRPQATSGTTIKKQKMPLNIIKNAFQGYTL